MPWPRDGTTGRPLRHPAETRRTTATSGRPIVRDGGDRRRQARARLADQHRQLAYARLAHEAMPLTRYYRHPKGGFYCRVVEGWRAA
jgi:hypothetical protein